jgi:regulation of enolase protein 1 (concanavalin A-like superfamily)
MNWFNEPHSWKEEDGKLTVIADPQTDFWRKTHYGFVRDNGHFYYERISGDFEVETEFRGKYEALYDQAGIMVRVDQTTWVKSGVEFVNGVHNVSAVVTRDFSDWSVVPLCSYPGFLRLRLKREGGTVIIEYRVDDGEWIMFRTAYFSSASELEVGRMVAAPDGPGFEATFIGFGLRRINS